MDQFIGLWSYIRAAFNIKYPGMFVSPNWIMLAAFTFLGTLINPGFFLIGAGFELTYLQMLAANPRFQRYIRGKASMEKFLEEQADWQSRISRLIVQLSQEGKKRFDDLKKRCSEVIDFYNIQLSLDPNIVLQHIKCLNNFLWIFLQLLVAKQAINKLIEGTLFSKFLSNLEGSIKELEDRINKVESLELKKSLEGKRDILKQRLQTLTEAKQKLAFIDAELDRIEQQVELIREQAALSKDAQGISMHIDSVSSSLSETSEWIKQQESLFGSIQKMTETPPQILQPSKNLEKQ